MPNSSLHKFHIPVMGLGFSIDTPIKVAHFGINSVISIVDDDLIEKMREVHCRRSGVAYSAISSKEEDYRAKRITAYLNLVDDIVNANFLKLINSYGQDEGEFAKYIELLPDNSQLKIKYIEASGNNTLSNIKEWALSSLQLGRIDVNIMTKVDKANYLNGEMLPVAFNDAHAALRGYANSKLRSSIVLSAGMNPRLYGYFENFTDFFPDNNGELTKKIILKVSDYRSAFIQGKFLAKKGLWVSEYRIESGLNCGGHAFATDGFLMGPILEEFKTNREELIKITNDIYVDALKRKGLSIGGEPLELTITAQGGVGTYEEQNFLLDHYNVDSVGWGTPFLLVPEVTNVDQHTLNLLSEAKEEDLYLSKISPLGVPFNSLRGNTKDIEKLKNVSEGKPGSPCPKKYLQLNNEFGGKPICSASITFQNKKIGQLRDQNLSDNKFEDEYEKIIDKACLCVGLATSTLLNSDAATKVDGTGVLVCPGPNLAYFSSIVSLKEMVAHIYGRTNLIQRIDRPNMFIKELKLYLNYLREKVNEAGLSPTRNEIKFFDAFQRNISDGINYYQLLFNATQIKVVNINRDALKELDALTKEFEDIKEQMFLLDLILPVADNFSNQVAAVN